jgi:hypothetical protein
MAAATPPHSADLERTTVADPTFSKGMDNDPHWTCICHHTIEQHTQGEDDAVVCRECDCPRFVAVVDAVEAEAWFNERLES